MRKLAAFQARADVIAPDILGSQTRFRTAGYTGLSPAFEYIPMMPPQFIEGGLMGQFSAITDPMVQPLPRTQDPAYYYGRYSQQSNQANALNQQYKILSQMPTSPGDPLFEMKQNQLGKINDLYEKVYSSAESNKQLSLQKQEAYNRQLRIQASREASPIVNKSASMAEQSARDLEQAVRNTKTRGSIAMTPSSRLHPEVQIAVDDLKKNLGYWNKDSRQFGLTGPKGGYLLSFGGNLPMIADAGRLMGGGGIGVSPDGLPMIQSKSEMQQDAGVPEELRGSFRISTDEEMANYRKELLKQDAETKRLEELGKVLLAKQERKKTNDAIDAGAGMLNKMSGSKDWSSILGL